jgi:multisubunit Na+/H+ antiporter MnhB subunit
VHVLLWTSLDILHDNVLTDLTRTVLSFTGLSLTVLFLTVLFQTGLSRASLAVTVTEVSTKVIRANNVVSVFLITAAVLDTDWN